MDKRASILIVDDERPLCETLKDLLERRDHRVDFRNTAQEALSAASAQSYEIVILDIRLPDDSGLDLLIRMEEKLPRADLLVMTAYSSLESAQRSVRRSVAGYFNKPLDLEHFLPLIDSIAERKHLERKNRMLEAFTKSVIRNVPSVIYSMDSDQLLTLISPQCMKLFGYSESEFLSDQRLWKKVVYPEDLHLRAQLLEACQDGGTFSVEYRVVNQDGKVRWVHDSGSITLGDFQGAFRLDGTLTDITERKEAEKQVLALNQDLEERVRERTAKLEAANQELEAFAYSVSHDLRAPLRAIHGFAEIIGRRHARALDRQLKHYLDNIIGAGALMGSLIEDLLAYSRLGRHALHCQSFPLKGVLEDALTSLREQIEGCGAEVLLPDGQQQVIGDQTLLTRILINLIENGLTYRRAGITPRIAIQFEATASEMRLTVRDNGIGIARQDQDKIFEVFQRLHNQDEHPGTGIGLAIVKKSAELLGGSIEVESAPGRGSAFRLRWWPCSESAVHSES